MDFSEFLIDETSTVMDALKQLDHVANKILFVSEENKLIATVTDGDIRRWILKSGNLDSEIKEIANYSPKSLSIGRKGQANNYMQEHSITALPIINENDEIKSIVFLNDEQISRDSNFSLPVVIMAGGLGTRLYPFTKILPKPLIPVGDIPIVERVINRFYDAGSEQFYLIINHKKEMIKAYFNELEKQYKVNYVEEETPLGTGGGLSLLKEEIAQTFILSNSDILIDADYEDIYDHHQSEGNLITMVCSLKSIEIPYGVVEIDESGEIESMQEKPELSFFTNTGVYIVEPKVIEELKMGTSIDFTTIIEKYKENGDRIGVYPISEYSWMDMGQLEELRKMEKRLSKHE